MNRFRPMFCLVACAIVGSGASQARDACIFPQKLLTSITPGRLKRSQSSQTGGQQVAPAAPSLRFLLPYKPNELVNDYRPTINANGTRIVFERRLPASLPVPNVDTYGPPHLLISALTNPDPQPLVTIKQSTARADWCWDPQHILEDGPITFSISVEGDPDGANGVYTTAPQANGTPHQVSNGNGWIYPTWYPSCKALAVDASTGLVWAPNPPVTLKGPMTVKVDPSSGAVERQLSGRTLWAGFPSVNPQRPDLIAFAGQPFSRSGYSQEQNFVYLANTAASPPSIHQIDGQEGRAPSWSPDGRWLAFESNRSCKSSDIRNKSDVHYAIFLADWMGANAPVQVTACSDDAQHAKWYRSPVNGRRLLIVTARLNPSYAGPNILIKQARGIASVDVTPFVTPDAAVGRVPARP